MINDIGCPSCDGDYQEMLDSDDNGTEFFALCVRCGVTFDSPLERRIIVLRQRIRQEFWHAEGSE